MILALIISRRTSRTPTEGSIWSSITLLSHFRFDQLRIIEFLSSREYTGVREIPAFGVLRRCSATFGTLAEPNVSAKSNERNSHSASILLIWSVFFVLQTFENLILLNFLTGKFHRTVGLPGIRNYQSKLLRFTQGFESVVSAAQVTWQSRSGIKQRRTSF